MAHPVITMHTTIIAKCCDVSFVAKTKREILDELMNHISHCHPRLWKSLDVEGENAAKSQVGCGYGGDWDNATKSFKHAWRRNALEQHVRIV